MKKIGLISDTHSHFEESIHEYFKSVDEIWHAGDIGSYDVIEKLETIAPVKAVYGNIDDKEIRNKFGLNLRFDCEGVDVFMTHIGGYPGRYNKRVKKIIETTHPQLYICGHSHILKVIPDKKNGLLHMNPGAAGEHGFHRIKTLLRFTCAEGKIKDLEVVELGLRGLIKKN